MASQFFLKYTDRLDFRLATQLKREGIEVVMLLPSTVNAKSIENGLKIYRVKPTPIVRSISSRVLKGSYTLDMFGKSLTIIKRESIDLLHAFFAIPPGLAMVLCKEATGRPLVLNVTGDDVGVVKEIKYGYRFNPVANELVDLVLKNADQILVPSYRFKEMTILAGADAERITVVPWGIDIEEFQLLKEEVGTPLTKNKFNLGRKEKIIVSLCRHTRVKGLNFLLEAMPKILHDCPNTKLVMAGLGKETEKLKSIAKNLKMGRNVVFPGYVRGTEKLQLLSTADVFVQPSLSDAFPISALEAMACGKPIVITNRVGLADFLKNGECGFIVESGNAQTLADAILKLLSDDNLRLRLGRKARAEVEEFNWDKIVKRVIGVYQKALA